LHSDLSQNPYGMPYQRPHIPSPIPQGTSDGSSPGFWRTLFGILVYPIYLLITLISIPVPILLNILYLIITILDTIMYPLTSTLRVMFKTFVIAPAGIAKAVLDVFYPIIAFVGGVVGVGCAMGLGAGWAGRTALEWLTGKKRRSGKTKRGSSGDKSAKRRSGDTKSERSLTVKTSQSKVEGSRRGKPRFATARGDRSHSDSASGPEIVTPKHDTKFAHQQDDRHTRDEVRAEDRSRKDKGSKEKSRKSAVDYTPAGYEETFRGEGRGTAREAYVLGTRKRTHVIGSAR